MNQQRLDLFASNADEWVMVESGPNAGRPHYLVTVQPCPRCGIEARGRLCAAWLENAALHRFSPDLNHSRVCKVWEEKRFVVPLPRAQPAPLLRRREGMA